MSHEIPNKEGGGAMLTKDFSHIGHIYTQNQQAFEHIFASVCWLADFHLFLKCMLEH